MFRVIRMSNNRINITVQKNTRERLAALGSKGESFDSIIVRLLDFWDEHKEGKETWLNDAASATR